MVVMLVVLVVLAGTTRAEQLKWRQTQGILWGMGVEGCTHAHTHCPVY